MKRRYGYCFSMTCMAPALLGHLYISSKGKFMTNFSQPSQNVPNQNSMMNYPKPKSIAAIIALVLGILALITSFLPIINNGSFILAVIGIILAIIGLVGTVRGKKSGKGIAIAALIISVVSCVVVLGTQSMYSAAIDEASESLENPAVSSSSETSDQYTDLALGTSVDFSNGVTVTVDQVERNLVNYDESEMTGVRVTYVNNGDSEASFNVFDWKGEDSSGAQYSYGYYSEADNELSSGTLAPGGSVTGMVYFEGEPVKVLYTSSVFSDSSASWTLS